MKKIYLYAGIGGWIAVLSLIAIGIASDSPESQNDVGKIFQMNEVVTHKISDEQNIAVRVTEANIVLDSKTPKTCILGNCIDDRKPGKYVLTVGMDITNLGADKYYDSSYKFEVEDAEGKTYGSTSQHLGLGIVGASKGNSFQTEVIYDIEIPISQYALILKQDWSDKETVISLNKLQKVSPELCQGTAGCFGGFVRKITDGDTVAIFDIESNEIKQIRLSLIDTPEVGEDNYDNAKDFVAGFCPVDSYVLFDEDDGQTEGSFGRQVGKLFCEGEPIHEKLLEHELAVIDTQFCDVSEYAREPWARVYGCSIRDGV